MKPGIYKDISIEAYHAGPGVSRSSLMHLVNGTPLDFEYARTHPFQPTPAMVLGSAIHAAVLEPDLFAATFALAPKFDRRTKAGKADAINWKAAHPGVTALTPDEYQTCTQAASLVRSKKGPANLLRGGHAEQSIYWKEPDTGILLRSRPDFLDLETRISVDLKTTSKPLNDRTIVSSLIDHGADVQAAMVNDAVALVTGERLEALSLLMVRTTPPMDLRMVRVGLDWLARGERIYREATRTFYEATMAGRWPGWADQGITECPMPVWVQRLEEQAEQQAQPITI